LQAHLMRGRVVQLKPPALRHVAGDFGIVPIAEAWSLHPSSVEASVDPRDRRDRLRAFFSASQAALGG
jgi:hypothetical protein